MEGVMDSSRGKCAAGFSFPLSLHSLRNSASFSPSVSGAWSLEEGGLLAVFTPSEPWPQGRRFEIRLPASLEGENGICMGKEFFSIFTVGAYRDPPCLLGAWRAGETGERIELVEETLEGFTENAGWEKGDRLLLVFSAPVDLLSVSAAIAVEGGSALVLEMPSASSPGYAGDGLYEEAFFRFDRAPAFESRFLIRLRRGIKDRYGNESEDEHLFRIFANGENSKPPSLVGIRIPMSPGGALGSFNLRAYGIDQLFDDLPIENGDYPYTVKTASWIECYFDCADGAAVDPFSLMEFFRVETSNNVLIFSPLAVRSDNFTAAAVHPPWEQYQRVEIAGTLTNTVNSGLVHFLINAGLKDSAGNVSDRQFRISLIK
jgi:hypothetical protein